MLTHSQQKRAWEEEHKKPKVLLQMDSSEPSSGVTKFYEWLVSGDYPRSKGLEICCGKGRNIIWLATQGVEAVGLDFSASATQEAAKRAKAQNIEAKFVSHDVTNSFPVPPASQDFVIDCFGSTDIESLNGRRAALRNIIRVLKPGGYLLVYLLSTDDEFHKKMIGKYPGPDQGSFIHPVNGKYEKAFTEKEVKKFYGELDLTALERIPKKAVFFGKEYACNHIWAVFRKPLNRD